MFKRALICTDLSDSLQRLANFVPELAKGGLTHLVFFHNVPLMTSREIPCVDEDKVSAAREVLSAAEANAPEGTTVEIEIASGRASENIVRAVKKQQPDIIFSGMPTRSALNEQLFGSTTKTLAEMVDIPILILRPQLVSTFRENELAQRCQNLFKYVLIPYDGSASAKNLLGKVKGYLESDPGGALETCLLSAVVDDGGRLASNNPEEDAQTKLDEAKAELDGLGSEILTEVRVGNPVEEVLKSGEVHDISAIAVCSGKSKGILNFTVPSFTSAILRESWHPIVHFPRLK